MGRNVSYKVSICSSKRCTELGIMEQNRTVPISLYPFDRVHRSAVFILNFKLVGGSAKTPSRAQRENSARPLHPVSPLSAGRDPRNGCPALRGLLRVLGSRRPETLGGRAGWGLWRVGRGELSHKRSSASVQQPLGWHDGARGPPKSRRAGRRVHWEVLECPWASSERAAAQGQLWALLLSAAGLRAPA